MKKSTSDWINSTVLKNETLSAHKGMDKTQIHHISIYKIMHLNHKYIHRMLIFKLHPPQKKHQLPNTFHHGNLVLSTPTPPPRLQGIRTLVLWWIVSPVAPVATAPKANFWEPQLKPGTKTVRGVFQENASRFTGMEIMTLDFLLLRFFGWEMNCSEVLSWV